MSRNEYHKKWRDANRDHVNAYSRNYAVANRQQRKLTTYAYRKRAKSSRDLMISQLFRTARTNARKAGIDFTISIELIDAWIIVQEEKCILTGFSFDYDCNPQYRARPFAPSIDRKDNKKGYTADNIQIVCCMVNRAKNEWSQTLFDQMCIARTRILSNG